MSRIGKQPIPLASGLDVKIEGSTVTVKGPKGQLVRTFPDGVRIEQEDGALQVRRASDEQHHRALHGLSRALLANMVMGVSEGFERTLDIVGTGYRADEDGKAVLLVVGYSHPVRVDPPDQISFQVLERGKRVVIQGIDKELVGQVAVDMRRVRPPEPYKGKGIRYAGEHVPLKAGKSGKGKKG